jgi:hypothetical protein
VRLVFYEAKLASDTRLRARERPAVIDQLEEYDHFIEQNIPILKEAYHQACRNLSSIRKHCKRYPDDDLIAQVANGCDLAIDPKVLLVIFGYNDDEKKGKFGTRHLQKLLKCRTDRVIAAGKAKDIDLIKVYSERFL